MRGWFAVAVEADAGPELPGVGCHAGTDEVRRVPGWEFIAAIIGSNWEGGCNMAAMKQSRRVRGRRIAALKGKLLMRHGDLLHRVEQQEVVDAPLDVPADAADQAVEASSTEIEMRIAEMRRGEMNRIEDALRRISDGTYGVCEWCGHQIPDARLQLLPNATLCVSCQQSAERDQLHGDEAAGEWERIPGGVDENIPVSACAGSKF